jgi:hypothetical protein
MNFGAVFSIQKNYPNEPHVSKSSLRCLAERLSMRRQAGKSALQHVLIFPLLWVLTSRAFLQKIIII